MDEIIQQLIAQMLARQAGGGQTAVASPRAQVQPEIPPEALLQIAADATRVAPRAAPRGPSIRSTPDPPLGNIIAQIVSGIEGGTIQGTPLDPREMGEESLLRPVMEGLLNRLRGPSGPTPGEGIPGLELAALLGAGAATPGPGEFRNFRGVIGRIVENPENLVTLVVDDAPAVERMLRAMGTEDLRAFSDVLLPEIADLIARGTSSAGAAGRALFHRIENEIFQRAAAGDRAGREFIFDRFGLPELEFMSPEGFREFASQAAGEAASELEEFEALTRFLMSAGGR